MPRPIIYFNNRFAYATTLSGTNDDTMTPVRRVADFDTTLRYPVASGTSTAASGLEANIVAVLPTTEAPSHLVFVSGEALSGVTVQLFAEQDGGGGSAQRVSGLLVGNEQVFALSGTTTAREQWRIHFTVSGSVSMPVVFEVMLADAFTLPRPTQNIGRAVDVQASRIPVPGGQDFVFKQGGPLRRRTYAFIETEANALSGVEDFVTRNAGSEPFYHVDDKGVAYWAEARGLNFTRSDNAGVSTWSLTVREIRANG